VKDELTVIITGVGFWRWEEVEECLEVLMERPRRRELQRLPVEAVSVLQATNWREYLREAA
jgi:hypothetical protein